MNEEDRCSQKIHIVLCGTDELHQPLCVYYKPTIFPKDSKACDYCDSRRKLEDDKGTPRPECLHRKTDW
jgi:hypothetical protein